jgi:hypothetical protein
MSGLSRRNFIAVISVVGLVIPNAWSFASGDECAKKSLGVVDAIGSLFEFGGYSDVTCVNRVRELQEIEKTEALYFHKALADLDFRQFLAGNDRNMFKNLDSVRGGAISRDFNVLFEGKSRKTDIKAVEGYISVGGNDLIKE